MSWVAHRIDELGLVSRGKSRHRPRDAAHLYGGPYPFIQTADVKHAGLYVTKYQQTYSEAGLAQSKLWPAGTLCITIAANIADTAILDIDACFPDSVIGFIPDAGKADARFIKYLFDATVQARFKQFTQGAAQDNLSQEKLLSLELKVPSVGEQRRIADLLSAYDDLIENNRRRIQLLEESARLLYREWFIHLRFPGHEHVRVVDGVPEGWGQKALGELCDDIRDAVSPSQVTPETPYIGLEHIPRRSITLSEWGTADQVVWEAMNNRIPRTGTNGAKLAAFVAGVRASDRVKASVKEKSADELLDHYGLADGAWLTHLGVLLVGTTADRRRLGTAPLVQAIKYDERGVKINKWLWDDCELSPLELPDAIWREVADFRESYEIPEGLYRRNVPAYDEKVVRELLVNALVHRPYTQRGDIFLNLHPDRLEVVNPGRLPLGVTPRNMLHASRRRNEGLARVFHDLGLMEKEGSGFDLIYDRLLSQGRPAPVIVEGADWVKVSIERRIVKPEVMQLLEDAEDRFQLNQRERICLGVLALKEASTARELMQVLEVENADALKPWLGRLPDFGLVKSSGRTQATRYFVAPELLRGAGLDKVTTLKRIAPHRLKALIVADLELYPDSSSADVNRRIGQEISTRTVKRALDDLIADGHVAYDGEKRWRRYRLVAP